jgi:hypothetical protein
MSPNDREDQEFEDFLQGKGELAQQLKSLPQPQPSDALTQAILERAQNELDRSEAANAASFSDTPRPGWISRMRFPLTLAASLMIGIAATMLWRNTVSPDSPNTQTAAQAPAPSITNHPEQVAAANAPAPQRTAATPPVVVAQADPPPINDNSVVMRSVPTPEIGPDTPPQAWLSIIATLIRQDKPTEALAQWDKFRRAYPDYAVPEAVQAQINALKK